MSNETSKQNIILELRNTVSAMLAELSMYGMTLALHNLSTTILLMDEDDEDLKQLQEELEKIKEPFNSLNLAGEQLETKLNDLNKKLFYEQGERIKH